MPVMSAAFMLHPESLVCRRDWTNLPEQTEDLNKPNKVMQEMATEEHKFGAMRTQYTSFRNECEQKSHYLSDEEAFSADSLSVPPHEWIETWMTPGHGLI